MSCFDLVIFDCDGVLVDTERIANQVFRDMLNDLGLSVSLEYMFEHFMGRSLKQCMAQVATMLGGPAPDTFEAQLRQRTIAALKDRIEPMPGVTEVLNSLTIPYCVASSGEHEKIRMTLGATGLLERFEGRIFSVLDVENPKPAPDVFLFAANRLGARPSRCAVVEDTPTGVRAGVTAGMHVFGFCVNTPEHRLRDAGAHVIFSDMRQLTRLLRDGQKPAQQSD